MCGHAPLRQTGRGPRLDLVRFARIRAYRVAQLSVLELSVCGSRDRAGAGECAMAGCAVGLGVDVVASNDTGSLIGETRQMMLLQTVANGADAMSARAGPGNRKPSRGAGAGWRSELGRIGLENAPDFGGVGCVGSRPPGRGIRLAALCCGTKCECAICCRGAAGGALMGNVVTVEVGGRKFAHQNRLARRWRTS